MSELSKTKPVWYVAAAAVVLTAAVLIWMFAGGGVDVLKDATGTQTSAEETATIRPPGSRGPVASRPPGSPGSAPEENIAPPEASNSPAATGEKLMMLSKAPERSLWTLSADSYDAGATASIGFMPYGFGPGDYGKSISVKITSSTPDLSAGARFPDLLGRSVVLILDDNDIDTGGAYSGTVVTRAEGDRLVLVLQSVEPLSD